MSKTIAMTLEVLTRSTVTVLVDVPEGVGPSQYAAIGKALYESTPEAMYTKGERSFERMSFDKSVAQADVAVRLNGDGIVELVRKDDLTELTLCDSGDLNDHRKVVLCAGVDPLGREIITYPATLDEVKVLTVRVNPDLDEVREEAIAIVGRSLFKGAIPESVTIQFESFTEKDLSWLGNTRYFEIDARIRRPRFAFTLSSYDEFSQFMFGMFGEDEEDLSTADFATAYKRYQKERSLSVAC